MTDLEQLISFYTSKIYVVLPCKITSIDGLYINVQPVIHEVDKEFPIIPHVPLLTFGNSDLRIKFNNKVGDVVTVLFSQIDLSKFLIDGSTISVDNDEKFNLTNAIALPFNIHKYGSEQTPALDFDIIGDVKITGKLFVKGDIEQIGDHILDGKVQSSGDVQGGGVSLMNHIHQFTWAGEAGTSTTVVASVTTDVPVVEEPI